MAINTAMVAIHLIFGAVWVGSIAFFTFGVLPLARDGNLERQSFRAMIGRIVWISRISALAMLVSGSHLMGTREYFDTDVLLETSPGLAVLVMILLWLSLIVIVELSTRRMKSDVDANLIRQPAKAGLSWFYAATVIGVLLFVDGAILATGFF